MNSQFVFEVVPKLMRSLPLTLGITFLSAILGLVFASLVALIRIKKVFLLNALCGIYSSFMRSNPGLIHLLLIYYGLPVLFRSFGIHIEMISKVGFSMITLFLYHAATVSEVIRSGYLSIDKGQHEAAESIGMTKIQRLRRIIIPQILPVVLPSYGNALIDLLGDTSLLYTIGVIDIMAQANIIISNEFGIHRLEVYIAVALIYWGCVIVIERIIKSIELKVSVYIDRS